MIRPVVVRGDGSCDVVNDETGHTGSIALGAVQFATVVSTGADPRLIVLTCPDGCGSRTWHPVSGDGSGSVRPLIQAVFMAKVTADGCPCGALTAGKSAALVRSHLRTHALQLGGSFVA